jgi:hypothetical protein
MHQSLSPRIMFRVAIHRYTIVSTKELTLTHKRASMRDVRVAIREYVHTFDEWHPSLVQLTTVGTRCISATRDTPGSVYTTPHVIITNMSSRKSDPKRDTLQLFHVTWSQLVELGPVPVGCTKPKATWQPVESGVGTGVTEKISQHIWELLHATYRSDATDTVVLGLMSPFQQKPRMSQRRRSLPEPIGSGEAPEGPVPFPGSNASSDASSDANPTLFIPKLRIDSGDLVVHIPQDTSHECWLLHVSAVGVKAARHAIRYQGDHARGMSQGCYCTER